MMKALRQLWRFGMLQALSCLFPVVIFASLALTEKVPLPLLPRYDWLLLICIGMQVLMVRTRLETFDEVKVIMLFHVIGLMLELFKVHMGSWAYPGEGYTKLFGVPLYSGFMYSSVASYMCQAWRRLDLRLSGWPSNRLAVALAAAIYLNFFTHHYWVDLRWWLTAAVVLVFRQTWVHYRVGESGYRMPLVVSFGLIGFFIWLAENIATFFSAWQYPNQADRWRAVHWSKLSSWLLLVIVSFLIVSALKRVKSGRGEAVRPGLQEETKTNGLE